MVADKAQSPLTMTRRRLDLVLESTPVLQRDNGNVSAIDVFYRVAHQKLPVPFAIIPGPLGSRARGEIIVGFESLQCRPGLFPNLVLISKFDYMPSIFFIGRR